MTAPGRRAVAGPFRFGGGGAGGSAQADAGAGDRVPLYAVVYSKGIQCQAPI
ncbi:hypothetical protein HMPREF0043_00255 [Actinobaculum sp. oral taxon 183 str. F0552]|nr:hypothetical protein HMPREF0043_00255 [Actinobaculum sp. oral taxon 183 str. F0552]